MGNIISNKFITTKTTTKPINKSKRTSKSMEQNNISIGSDYDYIFKIVFTGPSNCGKTKLLHNLHDRKLDPETKYTPTIGVEFYSYIWNDTNNKLQDNKIKLQFWDTSGDIRFRFIIESYFRGSNIFFIFYKDNEIENLLEYFKEHYEQLSRVKDTQFILISDCINPNLTKIVSGHLEEQILKNFKIKIMYHYKFDFNIRENMIMILDEILPAYLPTFKKIDYKSAIYISTN